MTVQAIPATSNDPHSRTSAAALTSGRLYLALGLICAGVGLVSVALGPDNYWDLRFYHLYAPWGYLHDRFLYDIGPAQEEGFLNPIADFLLYGLISSPLNESPRLVAFIMGAVHGINAAIAFAIAIQVIRVQGTAERWTLAGIACLMGASGAGFISLLGGCSNDLTAALFVLGSLYGLLKAADQEHQRGVRLAFAAAGLAGGLGIGLKYLAVIYAPGLAVVALLVAIRKKSISGLFGYGVAAAFAFLVVAGPHMYTLWKDFGSPTFPYLNQIFQSPYFEPEAIVEDRFIARDFWQAIAYPFYWTKVTRYVVVELPFRDWRGAIAYIAMAAGVAAFVLGRLRGDRQGESAPTKDFRLVCIFVVVSYFAWALSFGYYRYAMPLEMLTGVVTMGGLAWLLPDARLRIASALLVLAIAGASTVYLDWGRRKYDDRYIDVRVPPLPTNAVVFLATGAPVSYFIPFAEPKAMYVGIENNYLQLSQNNLLASEVKRVMRTPGRPKFALNVNKLDREEWNKLLAQFDLELSPSPCEPIRSNLEVDQLSLCRLVER